MCPDLNAVHRPETWQALCSAGTEDERSSMMDLYANYLDTVETHLLQEIAARSSHFFEAAGVVQDLRSSLTRTFQQVAGLRHEVRSLAAVMCCVLTLCRTLLFLQLPGVPPGERTHLLLTIECGLRLCR
jgi:hypothetical protein